MSWWLGEAPGNGDASKNRFYQTGMRTDGSAACNDRMQACRRPGGGVLGAGNKAAELVRVAQILAMPRVGEKNCYGGSRARQRLRRRRSTAAAPQSHCRQAYCAVKGTVISPPSAVELQLAGVAPARRMCGGARSGSEAAAQGCCLHALGAAPLSALLRPAGPGPPPAGHHHSASHPPF